MNILPCSAPHCDQPSHIKKRQLCMRHYNRFMTYGDYDVETPSSECRGCGGAIERARGSKGPSPQYCSTDCRAAVAYSKYKASGKYESDLARNRASNAKKARLTVSCQQCSCTFEAQKRDAVLCSSTCANKWRDAHNEVRCSELDCDRGVRAKGLCNMHWRRKAREDGRETADGWTERRKANYQKRRAQKLSLPADAIRPMDVYERDEWTCGICAQRVDRTLAYPDPLSASLDHILPLSRGGHHVLENVQLGHLSCNVRKGARVDAEAI